MSLWVTNAKREKPFEWHIGETAPTSLGRTGYFQADGDELEMILDAMRRSKVSDKIVTQDNDGKCLVRERIISVCPNHDKADDGPEVAILSVEP